MPDVVPFPAFVRSADVPATTRTGDHGGVGSISFRRLLDAAAFASAIDFVDVSVIPPGSAIGRHDHLQNEEVYFVFSGSPKVTIDGDTRRLSRGDISIVRSGQWHELVNDTAEPVEIFVVQVHV
jgi:mannose-6-phosphate isomerase-like protein (cupin superfamily)